MERNDAQKSRQVRDWLPLARRVFGFGEKEEISLHRDHQAHLVILQPVRHAEIRSQLTFSHWRSLYDEIQGPEEKRNFLIKHSSLNSDRARWVETDVLAEGLVSRREARFEDISFGRIYFVLNQNGHNTISLPFGQLDEKEAEEENGDEKDSILEKKRRKGALRILDREFFIHGIREDQLHHLETIDSLEKKGRRGLITSSRNFYCVDDVPSFYRPLDLAPSTYPGFGRNLTRLVALNSDEVHRLLEEEGITIDGKRYQLHESLRKCTENEPIRQKLLEEVDGHEMDLTLKIAKELLENSANPAYGRTARLRKSAVREKVVEKLATFTQNESTGHGQAARGIAVRVDPTKWDDFRQWFRNFLHGSFRTEYEPHISKHTMQNRISEYDRLRLSSKAHDLNNKFYRDLQYYALHKDLWRALQRIEQRKDTVWATHTDQQSSLLLTQLIPPLGDKEALQAAADERSKSPEFLRFVKFLFKAFGASNGEELLWKMELYRSVIADPFFGKVAERWRDKIYKAYSDIYKIGRGEFGVLSNRVDGIFDLISDLISESDLYAVMHPSQMRPKEAARVDQLDELILIWAGFSPHRGRHLFLPADIESEAQLQNLSLDQVKSILRTSIEGRGQAAIRKLSWEAGRKLMLVPLLKKAAGYQQEYMARSTLRHRQVMENQIYRRGRLGEESDVLYLRFNTKGDYELVQEKRSRLGWLPPRERSIVDTQIAVRGIPIRLYVEERDKTLEMILRKWLERENLRDIRDIFGRYIVIDTEVAKPHFTRFNILDRKALDDWSVEAALAVERALEEGAKAEKLSYRKFITEPGYERKDRLRSASATPIKSGATKTGDLEGTLKFYHRIWGSGENPVDEEVWIFKDWRSYIRKTLGDTRFIVERLRISDPGDGFVPVLDLFYPPFIDPTLKAIYEDLMRRPLPEKAVVYER